MALSDEQKKARLLGVGGSEIAAVAGLSPYATPLDVWRSKVEGLEIEPNEHMKRGTFLEDGIARWYADRTGAELTETGTIFHPSISRVFSTPDRLAKRDAQWDLSIKAPGPNGAREYGEEGTDHVPMTALLQLQWELLVLEPLHGINRGDLAALIGGELRVYCVQADPELQGRLVQIAQKFWRDYVETRTPPPVDGSESSSRWLADRFPEHRAPLLSATPEADELMRALKKARAEKAAAEAEEKAAINQLKALLGDAEGMVADAWRCTWKTTKGAVKTDWEALARELGAPQTLIEKFSHTTNGSRRFLPHWRDE